MCTDETPEQLDKAAQLILDLVASCESKKTTAEVESTEGWSNTLGQSRPNAGFHIDVNRLWTRAVTRSHNPERPSLALNYRPLGTS